MGQVVSPLQKLSSCSRLAWTCSHGGDKDLREKCECLFKTVH